MRTAISFLAFLVTTPAFAGAAACDFFTIPHNDRSAPCAGTFTVPSGGAMSTEITCNANGFVIKISCDLTTNPKKLSIVINGPSGLSAGTSIRHSLQLTDAEGNGASVNCQL